MPIQYGLHPNYTPGIWRGGMNAYNRRENLTPRSQLLDEFRMNKSARWQLTVCPPLFSLLLAIALSLVLVIEKGAEK